MIFLPLTVAEDDWAGWKILHGALGEQIELVGDDLFVTNVKYIQRGIDENLAILCVSLKSLVMLPTY
ncbi:hypothetical protein BT08F37_31440 [Escherichia coli]